VNSVPNGGRCYLNSVLFSYTVCGKVNVCKKKMQILSEEKMRAEWEIKYLFLQACFGSFLTYNLVCANAPGYRPNLLVSRMSHQISWTIWRKTHFTKCIFETYFGHLLVFLLNFVWVYDAFLLLNWWCYTLNNFFYTKKVKFGDLLYFDFFRSASQQSDNSLKQARVFDSFLWFHTTTLVQLNI